MPHPLKPVFMGITHEPQRVKEALESFKEAAAGKKRLYIEDTPGLLRHPRSEYSPLVEHADREGLKIIPLDADKDLEEHNQRLGILLDEYPGEQNYRLVCHGDMRRREDKWVRTLRDAPRGSLVVMHPLHARRVASRLGMEGNLVYSDQKAPTARQREIMEIGDAETARIKAERLARKMRKSKDRRT